MQENGPDDRARNVHARRSAIAMPRKATTRSASAHCGASRPSAVRGAPLARLATVRRQWCRKSRGHREPRPAASVGVVVGGSPFTLSVTETHNWVSVRLSYPPYQWSGAFVPSAAVGTHRSPVDRADVGISMDAPTVASTSAPDTRLKSSVAQRVSTAHERRQARWTDFSQLPTSLPLNLIVICLAFTVHGEERSACPRASKGCHRAFAASPSARAEDRAHEQGARDLRRPEPLG